MHRCLVNLQRAGKATLREKLPAHINHGFRDCKMSTSGDKDFSRLMGLPCSARTGCRFPAGSPPASHSLPWHGLSGCGDGVQPAAGLSETQPGEPLLGSHRDARVTALEAPSSLYLVGDTTCVKPGAWRRLTGDHLEVYALGSVTVATLVRDFSLSFHC